MPPQSTSTKVIQYVADLTQLKKDLSSIEALNRKLVNTYGQDAPQAVRRLGGTIESLKTKTIIDENGLQRTIPLVENVGQSFKTADGQLKQFTVTNKTLKNGTIQTSQSMKDLNTNTVPLIQNIKRLAERAALTIPVWLLLRSAVTGTIRAFQDSVKAIQEQDKAFQKARRNLEATAESQAALNTQFNQLRQETLNLSLQSGKSVEELTHAFQRFATVGFDAETSLAGMTYATKLAVAEFGDARETADAFARAMRVMIDRSDGAKSEAQQLAEAMALTDQLWQSNAFEINEFTHNLTNFASVAKAANLSTQETITLLATLSTGGLANRAGRLLRTTILKALENLDEVSQSLKLNINPAVDSTFDVIMKLVDALEGLSTTQKVPAELADVLGDLFSVRSTEVVASLNALRSTLKANAALVPDVKKLDGTFKSVSETTGILSERITNVNRQIGIALLTGITGGETFNESLKIILENLEAIQKRVEDTGIVLRTAFGIELLETFNKNLNDLEKARFDKIFARGVQSIKSNFGGPVAKILNDLRDKELKKFSDDLESTFSQTFARINKGLKGSLNTEDLKNLLTELETFGATNLGLDEGTFERITANLKEQLDTQKKIKEEQVAQEVSTNRQYKIDKALLADSLERLKNAGALTSEILDVEKQLKAQLGIIDKFEDALDRQLEKERAINEERRLRERLSSDAVKLFKIAQTEGTQVAKRIGDVLAGNLDFASFVRRGGKAVEVFKKEFESLFESKQAEAFFKGETVPDIKGLRGGARIELPTEDQAILKSREEILRAAQSEVSLAQKRLQIEQNITALREKNLIDTQKLINNSRVGFAPATATNSTVAGTSTRIVFNDGAIKLTVSGKNSEELNQKIDEAMTKATKQIKDKILGKQTNTF